MHLLMRGDFHTINYKTIVSTCWKCLFDNQRAVSLTRVDLVPRRMCCHKEVEACTHASVPVSPSSETLCLCLWRVHVPWQGRWKVTWILRLVGIYWPSTSRSLSSSMAAFPLLHWHSTILYSFPGKRKYETRKTSVNFSMFMPAIYCVFRDRN